MQDTGQDIGLIALQQQLSVMIPDIVRDKIDNLQIDHRDMARVLESEYPFDKPKGLLTTLPLNYPSGTPFTARLQLLQGASDMITWKGKEYVCNQLIFGHSGTDFVARALYMRVGTTPVDWHDSFYNVYDVNFAFAANCTFASKSPASALPVLVVTDMTEWWQLFSSLGKRNPPNAPLTQYYELDDPRRIFRHKSITVITDNDKQVQDAKSAAFMAHMETSFAALMNTGAFTSFIKRATFRWRNCVTVSPEDDDAYMWHAAEDSKQVLAAMAVAVHHQKHAEAFKQIDELEAELHVEHQRLYGPERPRRALGPINTQAPQAAGGSSGPRLSRYALL